MKRFFYSAFAVVALVGCAKERTTSNDHVAATFTATAITRVADNAWEEDDQIGISMTVNGETTLADGAYENVPHTVGEAGESGTFSPDDAVIYFPVDGSSVYFYAYYPYSTLDVDKNIAVSVASQSFSDIDIIAAKAEAKTKAAPTVTFSGDDSFEHQLSKLTITLKAGDGITSLSGLETTIKGQYTTAKYNIYSGEVSDKGDVADITAVTAADGTTAEAILIPTDAIAGSTIVFTLDGNDYTWDTKAVEFEQGSEHSYTVTLTRTGITSISGSTISNWGTGTGGSITASDL